MAKPFLLVLALFVSPAVLSPAPAHAWDVEADRAIANLAYERLTPAARTRVDAIIAAPGPAPAACRLGMLADAATVVECLHGRRGDFMKGVRYDPIPLCPPTNGLPATPDDCAKGACASQVLARAVRTLGEATTSAQDRVFALATVVYLTAELHQPLHAIDNGDRNGERVRVILPGSSARRLTLNGVWDEDLVADAIGSAEVALPYLRPLADRQAGQLQVGEGDIAGWVAETHQIAVAEVYGRLPRSPVCGKPPERPVFLDRSYIDAAIPVVRSQLAKAAVRLAALLNTLFE